MVRIASAALFLCASLFLAWLADNRYADASPAREGLWIAAAYSFYLTVLLDPFKSISAAIKASAEKWPKWFNAIFDWQIREQETNGYILIAMLPLAVVSFIHFELPPIKASAYVAICAGFYGLAAAVWSFDASEEPPKRRAAIATAASALLASLASVVEAFLP